MSDAELREQLQRSGWSLREACEVIYLRTGAVLKPKNIQNLLNKEGQLSQTLTGLFRLLFIHEGGTHERRA